jgi:eukaryotic-like serine/threonine-protein kinase
VTMSSRSSPMEFLDGIPLTHLISGKPLDHETLLSLAVEIADGLDAAHSVAWPRSVTKMFGGFNVAMNDFFKTLDFGLAKIAGAATSQNPVASANNMTAAIDPHLTSPGSTLGTIAYMSPEQARVPIPATPN